AYGAPTRPGVTANLPHLWKSRSREHDAGARPRADTTRRTTPSRSHSANCLRNARLNTTPKHFASSRSEIDGLLLSTNTSERLALSSWGITGRRTGRCRHRSVTRNLPDGRPRPQP